MGITEAARQLVEEEFGSRAIRNHPPHAMIHSGTPLYGVEDNMHLITPPDTDIHDVEAFKRKIARHMLRRINRPEIKLQKYICLFDRKTPPAKSAVEHKTRDKGIVPWPDPADDPDGPGDDARIFNEDYPHKPCDIFEPTNWTRFRKTRKLFRRHVYPLIFNTLIDDNYFFLEPGQLLILHGVPGQWIASNPVRDPLTGNITLGSHLPKLVKRGPVTKQEEEDDPDVYNRVWLIEGRQDPTGRKYMHYEQWHEATNDIQEADLAIVFYEKFFPRENCIVYGNDGDFIAIMLAYTRDRMRANGDQTNMWLCMPDRRDSKKQKIVNACKKKRKKKQLLTLAEQEIYDEYLEKSANNPKFKFPNPRTEMYFDMNELWKAVHEYNDWGAAGVQNHVVTLIAMLIMPGTDFFKHFLPGVNMNDRHNPVWKELMENMRKYTHLFQLSKQLEPDPRAFREPVIDRDLFVELCQAAYLRWWCVKRTKDEEKAAQERRERKEPDTLHMVRASLKQKELRRQKSITRLATKLKKQLGVVPKDSPRHAELVTKLKDKLAERTCPKKLATNRMCTRQELLVKCAQLDWNLKYIYNGYRDAEFPNPAETYNNQSLYGFVPDPEHAGHIIPASRVCTNLPPIDQVYSKWHIKYRRAQAHCQRMARQAQRHVPMNLLSPDAQQEVVDQAAEIDYMRRQQHVTRK